jgi:hypothetical protein
MLKISSIKHFHGFLYLVLLEASGVRQVGYMVSISDFLPIITILATGGGFWGVISRFRPSTFRKTELFNIFLLLGSFFLIFPLIWIGIQPNGILTLSAGEYSINLIDFQGWCLIYFSIGLIVTIIFGYFLLKKILANLEHQQFALDTFKEYRFILLSSLLTTYFILELILPPRGFDALYYYFPEAKTFYQAGRITEINYLSFLPVAKSPLNVLLYVYAYYITGELSIQLIPFLFLLGLVFLIYDFSLELFDNHSIAFTAAIFTLTLPFVYWLMNYWAFYQDLYLCYFFSVTCYFSLKWYKSPLCLKFGLFMGLGLVTSLLTKITAWILPIILVLWLPTGLRGKKVRVVLILVLTLFLCGQAATKIFIGATIPIIVSLGITVYFIVKETIPNYPRRSLIRIIPIFVGMVIGSFWLLNRMTLSSSVWKEIYNQYFSLSQSIEWIYSTPQDPLLNTLENVHRVNFISAIGILLLGTGFVLPWIVLKVYALKDFRPITAPFIWLLVFFAIWSAYYLNGSMRYLSPAIAPIVLSVSWGFHQLTKKIDSKAGNEFVRILFAFLGCFNFYYLIPLKSLTVSDQTQEVIGLSYNKAALNYYSHPEILILLSVGFSLLFIVLIIKNPVNLLSWLQKRINIDWLSNLLQNLAQLLIQFRKRIRITWMSYLLLGITVIIPMAVQSYLLLYTQGDLAQFYAIHEYEYRDEYQDLVTIIRQQDQPYAGIMTVRTPGLQFFTGQPVIDIYYQGGFFQHDPFYTSDNLTELMDVLRNPLNHTVAGEFNFSFIIPIRYIVVPSSGNLYYNIYLSRIRSKSYFFQSLDNETYFIPLYKNSDFNLFEAKL